MWRSKKNTSRSNPAFSWAKDMKIARSTKERIESIKDDALEKKRELETLHARLAEHSGTKRIASKLERVIDQLEHWIRAA